MFSLNELRVYMRNIQLLRELIIIQILTNQLCKCSFYTAQVTTERSVLLTNTETFNTTKYVIVLTLLTNVSDFSRMTVTADEVDNDLTLDNISTVLKLMLLCCLP
ncbi:hypothetical protein NP493_206g01020 [Ridgeia piscesae]|uniref:Uncharacterized protein n=1 Tax=Ridgeia piscesae TaxID=27915 RepID=A0AAD9P1B0_RIDPI|nr:hypothetical protein NP493_206g01020 [Ridgeia piscesae]